MSKPFAALIADRSHAPERVVREALARVEKWAHLSSNKTVTLDEVAWLASVLYLAGIKAQEKPGEVVTTHSLEGNVHTIVADDSTRSIADYVGGKQG